MASFWARGLCTLAAEEAELMLVANFWKANKIWSASNVAGVFSLVERAFFCFSEEIPGEQEGISSWIPVTMSGPHRLSFWTSCHNVRAKANLPWTPVTMSWPTSGPEFCVVWLRKRPASGWGSLCGWSSFVPWFFTFVFRNVSGTVPEGVRICRFKRKSFNLDSPPKMQDSVLLNSWDSFLVTLPSIFSETCVIYSPLILGRDVFRDWPFLGCSSCVSFVTAANFRWFLNVAIFRRENATQSWRRN